MHEARLREGWRPVGRKIGFTNRRIWPLYGVFEPIWGWVYDRTLIRAQGDAATVVLSDLQQPRIEPEICFKLRAAPRSSNPADLLEALEWVAHSVEIVQCDQPGWKTSLEHSTAFNGLHGRLIVGSPVALHELDDLLEASLPGIEMILRKGEQVVDRGTGEIVLGSPLSALGYLVDLLAKHKGRMLAAGEIVSTGTLTDAHPVAPGETWRTELIGLPLAGLRLRFA